MRVWRTYTEGKRWRAFWAELKRYHDTYNATEYKNWWRLTRAILSNRANESDIRNDNARVRALQDMGFTRETALEFVRVMNNPELLDTLPRPRRELFKTFLRSGPSDIVEHHGKKGLRYARQDAIARAKALLRARSKRPKR